MRDLVAPSFIVSSAIEKERAGPVWYSFSDGKIFEEIEYKSVSHGLKR